MIHNSLPMAGYNAMKERKQTRSEKIAFCVWATASVYGVEVSDIKEKEWAVFEAMTDEQLEDECNYFDDLLSK